MNFVFFVRQFILIAAMTASSLLIAAADFPLQQYVNQPDDSFRVNSIEETSGEPGTRVFRIEFDSLSWRNPDEVNRQVWSHVLIVAVPDVIENDAALLVINGGRNPSGDILHNFANKGLSDEVASMTKAIVGELQMIPNQPLVFGGDGQGRKEDDLIAYSWARYLENKDPTWLAQFPMTKASVRAMDVMGAFVRTHFERDLERFVVTGASKRGWTSWLVAAVDERVVGVAPIVIDVLNMIPSMKHHFASLGFWSDAIKDYVHHGIMDRLDTPEVDQMADLIDPYRMQEFLTEPKFVINAANDQFFMPDSGQFYVQDLPGDTYVRYVPNSGHFVNNFDAVNSLMIFFDAVTQGKPMPSIDWQREGDWQLSFTIEGTPKKVTLWEATSLVSRDFRFSRTMPRYIARDIPVSSTGRYDLAIQPPVRGYKAYFVEAQFADGPLGYLKLTTDIKVGKARD